MDAIAVECIADDGMLIVMLSMIKHIMFVLYLVADVVIQESLANAKGSARQPWYIVHKSPNRPRLGLPSSINIIYTSLKSTFSALQFPR